MSVVYAHCPPDVAELARPLIMKYHPDLLAPEKPTKLDFVFAEQEPNESGQRSDTPAVKLHGVPCYAVCKIIPSKQRAFGRGDIEICIDRIKWDKLSVATRKALLDHELNHIIVRRDKHDAIITDAYERPKHAMRPHDREFGWFDCVAQRHRGASLEVQQAKVIAEEAGSVYWQGEFSFAAAA